MKAKKIYKKDVKIVIIKYYDNVKQNTIREIRILGRKVGYINRVNTPRKYEVELYNDYLFVENIGQKHFVDNYDQVRNLLKGYHLQMDIA